MANPQGSVNSFDCANFVINGHKLEVRDHYFPTRIKSTKQIDASANPKGCPVAIVTTDKHRFLYNDPIFLHESKEWTIFSIDVGTVVTFWEPKDTTSPHTDLKFYKLTDQGALEPYSNENPYKM